jgi:hypothetical protein
VSPIPLCILSPVYGALFVLPKGLSFGKSGRKPTFAIAEIAAKFARCHDDIDDYDDNTDKKAF